MLLAAALGFVLMERSMRLVPALLGSTMWVLQAGALLLFEGGNYPEEFALRVQFAALYLFWLAHRTASNRWRWYAIGSLAAIAFLASNCKFVGVVGHHRWSAYRYSPSGRGALAVSPHCQFSHYAGPSDSRNPTSCPSTSGFYTRNRSSLVPRSVVAVITRNRSAYQTMKARAERSDGNGRAVGGV